MKIDTESKYFISSGCSYGVIAESIKKNEDKIDTFSNRIIILNFSLPSQSAYYSCDSIIYSVNVLLAEGVPSENIYVINEWTQWNRFNFTIPHSLNKSYQVKEPALSQISIKELNSNDEDYVNFLYEKLKISTVKIKNAYIGVIDRLTYSNPSHIDLDELSEYSLEISYHLRQQEKLGIHVEDMVNNYFNTILRLQFFLKAKNIKYNFIQMYSQFDYWTVTDSWGNLNQKFYKNLGYTKHGLIDYNINNIKKWKSKLNDSNLIWNVIPEIKWKIDLIDFSNFWLYQDNGWKYGGVDEYCLDKFEWWGYFDHWSQLENQSLETLPYQLPDFGMHPNEQLYLFIADECLFNCDFLRVNKEKLSEFYEYIKTLISDETMLPPNYKQFSSLITMYNNMKRKIL